MFFYNLRMFKYGYHQAFQYYLDLSLKIYKAKKCKNAKRNDKVFL